MGGKAITLESVSHYFEASRDAATGAKRKVEVLRSTTTKIEAEQFVALVGPSGCGKTTVLNMVAGLIMPSAGVVQLGQSAPRLGDPQVGYLLARDALLPWRTALENVALPLEIRGVKTHERNERASKLLRAVGLGDFEKSYPSQLSHGMRQRVAVARTLAIEPTTVLMDEPFSALDAQTRIGIQQQFLQLWERLKSTVLFVTHDLTEAILLADRVIVFSSRPGAIKGDFKINLKRPRSVIELQGSSEFHQLFQEIWGVLRDEVTK